jgi:hypothetical protein
MVRALKMLWALLSVSWYSLAGSEPPTIRSQADAGVNWSPGRLVLTGMVFASRHTPANSARVVRERNKAML